MTSREDEEETGAAGAPVTLDVPSHARARPRIAWRLPAGTNFAARFPARRRRLLGRMATDFLLLALALGGSQLGARWAGAAEGPLGWMLVYAGLTLVLLAGRGGYRFRLSTSSLDHVGHVLSSAAIAATIVITGRVLLSPSADAATQIVRWWGFSSVYLAAGRVGLSVFNERAKGLTTLIIGAGTVGQIVAKRLHEHPEMGLKPIGYLDKEPMVTDGPLPVLGASWDLEEVVRREGVDHVIITFSRAPHSVLLGMVRSCRTLGVEISLVPRLFEQVSNRVTVEHLGGVALLRVDQADPRGWQFDVKYALDRIIGCLSVVLIGPLLALLALVVRLTSPGPILFRQERVGLDGQVFEILKFRTMQVAEGRQENDAAWAARTIGAQHVSEPTEADEAPADPRTPIGRFLRRWSLDELPQLINVAKGDMALVGPRPERTGYVRSFEEHVYRYGDRHRVKSGLTGWAQVNGLRGETPLEDRVEWDNYYVENWSPWLDARILLLTPFAVISGRGTG